MTAPKHIPRLAPALRADRARTVSRGYVWEIREMNAVTLPPDPRPSKTRTRAEAKDGIEKKT